MMEKKNLEQPSSILPQISRRSLAGIVVVGVVTLVIVLFIALGILARAPEEFPNDYIYVLESGSTLRDVSNTLAEQGVIKSRRMFELYVVLTGNDPVIAGDYLFEHPQPVHHVASRITSGDYGDSRIRVVLHEGLTVAQMADVLEESFPGFNKDQFLRLAKDKEGYLFPDTYFFFPSTTTKQIYDVLTNAFENQAGDLLLEIEESPYTIDEIITMASIIEREAANNNAERKIISGILWKRIEINMPLQVDAPFVYILGKGSAQLTRADLEEDSPYNTYTNLGLPPGPIGNPGLNSIKAALYPTETDYLYYLHGTDGVVRYGRNFDEHVANKRAYLN